jgi:hypothetical protein
VQITPQQSPLVANPQVTGGISFDKIITLLSEMGGGSHNVPEGPRRQAARDLERMGPLMPGQAAGRGRNVAGTSQFQGMVALLTSYLRNGQAQQHPLNYAKLVSGFLMLRTDFGSMFLKLPPAERAPYQANPEQFVTLVMNAAQLQTDAGAPVLERGVRKGQTPGRRDYDRRLDNAATRLTRREWLTGITQGQDRLSSHHLPDLRSELEGLGALGPTTDPIGPAPAPGTELGLRDRGQGIVMEFRRMAQTVPWDQWRDLAIRIHGYIAELNNRDAAGGA